MSKIYTKTGDKGFTSLVGGKRVKKNDPFVEAYGTIDEVNSMIGVANSKISNDTLSKLKKMLVRIQEVLFYVGAELSTPEGEKVYWPLKKENIDELEAYIDELQSELPELKQFILPGGSELGATLHLIRAVVRRAERSAVDTGKEEVIRYLNRCSDFMFVAARWANLKQQTPETIFLY